MKKSKLLSLLLVIAILLSCIVYMPAANVATQAAVATEKAIFIGKTGTTNRVADIIIPLGFKRPDHPTWGFINGNFPFKLTFKYKTLTGSTGPRVSYFITNTTWRATEAGASVGDITYSNGVCTATFNINKNNDKYWGDTGGNRWGYVAIGNAAYSSSGVYSPTAYDSSFIISDIKLYFTGADDAASKAVNLLPALSEDTVNFNGTYYFRTNNCTQYDSPFFAESDKWNLLGSSLYTKLIDVPSNYNTSTYDSGFTSHAATNLTYQYYTNNSYSGLKFRKLDNSADKGFEIIDSEKKQVIIIGANHQDEAESTSSYNTISYNRPANIFLPISLDQYFTTGDGRSSASKGVVAKVTFDAVRLEGTGAPVIGRIYGSGWGGSNAGPHYTLNVNNGDYSASSANFTESYRCTYNPTTGKFVGYTRMWTGASDQLTVYGITEVLTIGNAEYSWNDDATDRFDSTGFNSSFAISNIVVELYEVTVSDGKYTPTGSPVASIAPLLATDTVDVDTPYAFRRGYSVNGKSQHSRDVVHGSQLKWQAEGEVGLITCKDLTTCIYGAHSLTHHAATMNNTTGVGTREYWSCSTCSKNFADNYGGTQITDTSAKKQMLVMDTVSSGESIAYIPLRFTATHINDSRKWYKFTCDIRKDGSGTPKVTDARGLESGFEAAYAPDADNSSLKVYSSSYENNKLTAYILLWLPDYSSKNTLPYAYESPATGAQLVLNIGNADYEGNSYSNVQTNTTFYLSNPELKALNCDGTSDLATASAASTTGNNLVPDFTDKTVRFDNAAYSYSNATVTDSKTRTGSGTPMSAPLGMWGTTGTSYAKVTTQDIKAGLFDGTNYTGSKMLCISGNSSNTHAINYETTLPSKSTNYYLSFKCRAVGGATPAITPQCKYNSSYENVSKYNTPSYDGRSYRIDIGTWSNTPTNTNNFKLYLGMNVDSSQNGSVYFYDFQLKSYSDANTNLITNGQFSAGLDTVITENFNRKAIEGWTVESMFNMPYVAVEQVPSGFFTDDSSTNYEKVYEFKGSNTYKPQFGFTVQPSASYRITYDYDCAKNHCVNAYINGYYRSMTLTKNSGLNKTGGKFQASYTLTNNTSYTDGTGTISFALNGNNYDSAFSISNIRIYKLDSSGNPTGANLAYDLNTILSDASYGVSSVGSKADFTLGTGTEAVQKAVLGGGVRRWIGNTTKGAAYSKVVKTDGNLFKYYTVDERYEYARAAVLNGASNIVSQSSSKFYDPKSDSTIDVLDMVRLELDSYNGVDTQFDSVTSSSS